MTSKLQKALFYWYQKPDTLKSAVEEIERYSRSPFYHRNQKEQQEDA